MNTGIPQSMETNSFYASLPLETTLSEDFELSDQNRGMYVSKQVGLGAAIGALTAIVLELAVGVGIYCAWHFRHLLR